MIPTKIFSAAFDTTTGPHIDDGLKIILWRMLGPKEEEALFGPGKGSYLARLRKHRENPELADAKGFLTRYVSDIEADRDLSAWLPPGVEHPQEGIAPKLYWKAF